MRPVLITGGAGQLGQALARTTWPEGLEPVALARSQLDLADVDRIAAIVASRPWAAVINAGAYTAVDRAEAEPVAAWRVNALAPAALAAASHAAGIPMVQVSTDYVFDGARPGAREPDDPVGPISVYGGSKLGGELAVRTACPRHVILRTAWVVSAEGRNFVTTMLRLAEELEEVRVVGDQHGAPTSAADLAAALVAVTARLAGDATAPTGTYHFSNAGATSWHGFAQAIFANAARRGRRAPRVIAVTSADFPTPARRPANSLLSTATLTRDYGIVARPWHAALDDILDEAIGPAK